MLFQGRAATLGETQSTQTPDPHLTHRLAEPNVRSAVPTTIRSADLRNMTEEERARVIDEAFEHADETEADYLAELDARIKEFEVRYEVPTSGLYEALAAGRLYDTADVSQWMFWADVREDILARKARP